MTPYQQGYWRVVRLAGLEKQAVRLPDLRKATKALQERVPIIRRNLAPVLTSPTTIKMAPSKVREGLAVSQGMGPATIAKMSPKKSRGFVEQQIAPYLEGLPPEERAQTLSQVLEQAEGTNAPLMVGGKSTIFQGGSPAELFADHSPWSGEAGVQAMRKSGPGQEAFNRWVLLHEGSEAGKHFGDRRFASHLSTRPMLNDLNIAATLEGPGQEAAGAIRDIRADEISEMAKYVPGLERLNLGEERISRHAQKRLQQAYERGLAREGVEGIPGFNV